MAESTTLQNGTNTLVYVASSEPTDETSPVDAAYSVVDNQIGHDWNTSKNSDQARNKRTAGVVYSSGTDTLTLRCHFSRIAADGQDILETSAATAGSQIWVLTVPNGLSQKGKWAIMEVGDRSETSNNGVVETVTYTLGAISAPTSFTTPAS